MIGEAGKMSELPTWVYLLGTGVALWAWLEARVMLRKECALKHHEVDQRIAERQKSTHELRNFVTPLALKVEKIETMVEATRDEVKLIREWLEKHIERGGAG